MKLANTTQDVAKLVNTCFGEDEIQVALIVRSTYQVSDGGLVASYDDPWPIAEEPIDTDCGLMAPEMPYLTGGVDVLLGGRVHARGGRQAMLDVELQVGRQFRRRVAVFGDRTWVRQGQQLVPSAPKPFSSMPLSYARAFGGLSDTDYGKVPFPANPDGVGFYSGQEEAVGQPLPNLEDPLHPVTHAASPAQQTPAPVGLGYYPMDGALRALDSVDMSEPDGSIYHKLSPRYFNQAHPNMIIDAAKVPEPGDIVRLTYGRRDGDLEFEWPDRPLHVHMQLEDAHYLFPLHIDQLGIVAGADRVFFSHRVVLRYRVIAKERRLITLHEGPVPDAVPSHYIQRWSDDWDADWWDQPDPTAIS